jgi:ubiquinone/menaquinone biosynthesis C-methylase UbiE
VGGGRDFEYHTSPDEFLVVRCTDCDVIYLDPRPVDEELARIYPDDYHAYDFDAAKFGLIYRARRKLEGRRIMAALGGLPTSARIIDIGCGDGFHLDLVREFGSPSWEIEGIDIDDRAVGAARDRGLTVHLGVVEKLELPDATFDAALMIMVVEHVADPLELLKTARRLIRPGGRLVVVTDNTGSPDFALTRRRHWGGYHFPRHWYLFNRQSLEALGRSAGFEVDRIETIVSPVNWVYSVHNFLDDRGAPRRLVDAFSLHSAPALGAFTVLDSVMVGAGRGALLRAVFEVPPEDRL